MTNIAKRLLPAVLACLFFTQCGPVAGPGNLGGPTVELRNATIAAEPTGDFFYGRRYYIEKTRFWGYLRKPRQPWSRAKLVMMDESRTRQPDRFLENGPPGQRYGQDNNYEYRITGAYTGREAYDPNSNQFLPVFSATSYQVVNRQPGWLFSPSDRYDRYRITMTPR
ncbi:MAG: hypothetical protein V4733_02425 [Verrucomicrobiota bacterium]